jgi:hypothetical protein
MADLTPLFPLFHLFFVSFVWDRGRRADQAIEALREFAGAMRMKFREVRIRYFESLLARATLHICVSLGWIYAAFLALQISSWVPIGLMAFVTTLLEGIYWFDTIYGWKRRDAKSEG